MTSVDPRAFIGKTLGGRYRLVRLVGQGGMGAVFEARQEDLGRDVALKLLLDVDGDAVARFEQEARATSRLRSPHVVSIFDFHVASGEVPFVVMELLVGETLATLLRREGRLAPERAVSIARQMLEGLAAAHAAGIVHRDIKPSNVWVSPVAGGELVKLLDFGIAKVRDASAVRTTTGVVLGTPAYLAPEQIFATQITGTADVHATATVLYEALAGVRPFGSPGADLYEEILHRVPPPVTLHAPHVPPAIADAIARALEKSPDARPSARAFSDALRSATLPTSGGDVLARPHDATVPAHPATPSATPREETRARRDAPATTTPRLWIGVVAALIVVVLGGAIGVFALRAGVLDHGPLTPTPAVVDGAAPDADGAASAQALEPEEGATTAPVTHGAPSAADAAPDPRAPTPPSQGARAAGAADCWCSMIVHGEGLCLTSKTPRCTCSPHGRHVPLCPVTPTPDARGELHCAEEKVRALPGAKTGDACVGYIIEDGATVEERGALDCVVCYGEPQRARATDGAPCTGLESTGRTMRGRWVCSR